MKIVYILNTTNLANGASKSFVAMLEGLMQMGIQPLVVIPDRNGLYHTLTNMGVTTVVLDYRPCTYPTYLSTFVDYLKFIPRIFGRLYLNRRATKQLIVILKEKRPDIIHTNVGVINIGYKAAKALGIPHIYHIREYGDRDFKQYYFPCHSRFIKQLEQPNSYSICITKDIQKHHKQAGKATSIVIYDGIMHQKNTVPKQSTGNYFLYVGRIEPAKGIMFLLKAYNKYIKTTKTILPLHIVGDTSNSSYKRYVEKYVIDTGLNKNVIFWGERNDVNNFYSQAKAIIIPSRCEGFGLVMAEAMSCGCLAIGRNTGGTKEQMDNGVALSGKEIALRFDSIEELAKTLEQVTQEPVETFSQHCENAFHTVNARYTVESNVKNVYNYYKGIYNGQTNKTN